MKQSELRKLIKEAIKDADPNLGKIKDPNDTSDERMLKLIIDANNQLKTRLGTISTVQELDGFFKTLMSYTQIENVSKMTIMTSLKKGLDSISPNTSTITTKKPKK